MPINNSTYTRPPAKERGAIERAAKDKQRFCQTKFTIRFRNSGIEFEHTKKRG